MNLLIIDWVSVGVKTAQFILSFSILVILHELGHFLPARWFKCRVEKFYLFFNPWFSLWKKQKGETEYGLGWVPFGGYVKIAGMVDESMDKEQLKLPPQPWEFRSKPAWQRLIIMVGGVVVNVLLAIVIFIGITWVWGEEYLPARNIKYGVYTDSLARSIGIQDGDHVIGLDDKRLDNFATLEAEIILNESKNLQVERNGQLVNINIPADFTKKLVKSKQMSGMVLPRYPAIVDSVGKEAVFSKGRLQKGDRLLAFNGNAFDYYNEFQRLKKGYSDSMVSLSVLRGADTVTIRARVNGRGMLGFSVKNPFELLGAVTKNYSLLQSIPTLLLPWVLSA